MSPISSTGISSMRPWLALWKVSIRYMLGFYARRGKRALHCRVPTLFWYSRCEKEVKEKHL